MAKDEVKKPEEKLFTAEDMQNAVKAAAKAVAEEMVPAMAAMAALNQGAGRAVRNDVPIEKCQDCGQARKTGCMGEHEKIVVYPTRYQEFGEWFQGAFINGVRYLSNDAGHQILVPKNAVGTILKIVQGFEDNERDALMGKKKQHNSGHVSSPRSVGATGADGWR